ncbi:PREDICTED: protein scabrous-like [Drosophila arizonae]|uniref:Protein scabrous-like n=1 Tax=Drosophila arizonae TaxID=7263 RepID=A0ABM1Q0U9_DROAR|nr:PREDICTED: protein scabrous-like [Drosophila arizonae]
MLRLTALVVIVALVVAGARGATTSSGNILVSDENNMLRDAQTAGSTAPIATATATATAAAPALSSVELLRFVNEDEDNNELELLSSGKDEQDADAAEKNLKLGDQVRLLTKQLNALMTRRREDYELLEHNLRKSLRLTTDAASVDADMRSELDQLRREMQTLRATHSGNKERLTVEWLQQSISEIRKQLVELQRTAGSVAKDVRHGGAAYEDLATIRSDYQQLKLELAAQRERQEQTEVIVQELREELLQQEQEYKHDLNRQQQQQQQQRQLNANAIAKEQQTEQSASIEEDSSSRESSQEVSKHTHTYAP